MYSLINLKGNTYMDSREVAEIIGKRHTDLMRDVNRYKKILTDANLRSLDFFKKSSYVDSKNQKRPYYLVTKQGCELIANKLTGKKGVLFTAKYVQKFNNMEKLSIARAVSKIARRELTDVLRDSLPDSPHKHFMYKHYTDLAYKVAIGCTAKQFKKLHGLSPSATIKDYLAVDELTRVQKAEELIKVLVNLGKDYEYIKDFVLENFQAQKSFSSKTTLTQANQQLSG